MSLLTQLLSKNLRKRNTQLDLWGSDRRVLCIAQQDLKNYLKVHWKLSDQDVSDMAFEKRIQNYSIEKPRELEEFIYIWTGIWIKKWNERVKIILDKKFGCKRADELLKNAFPVWNRFKQKNEIKDLVIEVLVKNGEICGTAFLAENLLLTEIGLSVKRKVNLEENEPLLNIVNNALRRARRASRSKGPLIFLRVSRNFFKFS